MHICAKIINNSVDILYVILLYFVNLCKVQINVEQKQCNYAQNIKLKAIISGV